MNEESDTNTRTLAILTHETGLLEMMDGRSTPDDRRWAQGMVTEMGARIAARRRDRLPASVPIKRAAPMTARLLAMPRAALETLFTSLTAHWGAAAQIAHRNLEMMSDNDLRRIIQTVESHAKEK